MYNIPWDIYCQPSHTTGNIYVGLYVAGVTQHTLNVYVTLNVLCDSKIYACECNISQCELYV